MSSAFVRFHKSKDQLKVFLVTCLLFHILYIIPFSINRMWVPVHLNVVSIVILAGLVIAIQRFHSKKARIIIYLLFATECIYFTAASTYYLAWNYNTSILLICMIPNTIFLLKKEEVSKKFLIMMSSVYLVAYISQLIWARFHYPSYGIQLSQHSLFYGAGISILVIGMLTYNGIRNEQELHLIQQKLYRKNQLLTEIADIDSLTGIFNRRKMNELIEKAEQDFINKKISYSLTICDIDDFKLINDQYGHIAGDYVLAKIGCLMKKCVPCGQMARWGGEEFIILQRGKSKEECAIHLRVLGNAIQNELFIFEKEEISVTMTMGEAHSDEAPYSKELLKRADKKLYSGKQNGKNKVVS